MKILFISHESSRTGAPTVLLHLLSWIRQNRPEIEVHLILLNGGGIREAFVGQAHVVYEPYLPIRTHFTKRIINKLLKKSTPKNHDSFVLKKLANNSFDVIYANSVVSLPFATKIKKSQKI